MDELLEDGTLLPITSPKRKSVDEAIADRNRRSSSEDPEPAG
jgi:hypothetical protein